MEKDTSYTKTQYGKKKKAIVRSKKDLLYHRATNKVSGNIRCY